MRWLAGSKDVVRALAHVDERGIYLSASQDKCVRAWLAPSRKATAAPAAHSSEGRARADTFFAIEVLHNLLLLPFSFSLFFKSIQKA
jgi:hypothetical protein